MIEVVFELSPETGDVTLILTGLAGEAASVIGAIFQAQLRRAPDQPSQHVLQAYSILTSSLSGHINDSVVTHSLVPEFCFTPVWATTTMEIGLKSVVGSVEMTAPEQHHVAYP